MTLYKGFTVYIYYIDDVGLKVWGKPKTNYWKYTNKNSSIEYKQQWPDKKPLI